MIFNSSHSDPGYALPVQTVNPDQMASEEAIWSGSALFVFTCVILYQQPGLSNLCGRKLEVGMAS